jgi:hypothetical protein
MKREAALTVNRWMMTSPSPPRLNTTTFQVVMGVVRDMLECSNAASVTVPIIVAKIASDGRGKEEGTRKIAKQ